jgi:hypothetical protein
MPWREKRVLVTGGVGFFRLIRRGEIRGHGHRVCLPEIHAHTI